MLEAEIRQRLRNKSILLMTHIVIGYPSFGECRRIVETMVELGVDMIELQIPFSEPIADGPVIVHANQKALEAGATVDRCFELISRMTADFAIPFVLMTYYNVAFVRGLARFADDMRQAGLRGVIIPDLPYEEGDAFFSATAANGVDPILILSPNTSDERLQQIARRGRGFLYCVARKGVTGAMTDFSKLDHYLHRCREATALPLALGFGVKTRHDIEQVAGRVEIAVVGSETIQVLDRLGPQAVGPFISGLGV